MTEDDGSTHPLGTPNKSVSPGWGGITQRHYFSLIHIRSGALCARKAGEIEQRYHEEGKADTPEERDNRITNHKAYITSSTISTVSFLESSVNELLTDIVDESHRVDDLDSDFKSNVQSMEQNYNVFRGHSILEKYQVTLLLADEELFDTGSQPYQDVATLKQLRNYFVHYTPEDVRALPEPVNPDIKMGQRLQDKGFDLNPLVGVGNAFFPDKCLSHGCASWGFNSALEFTDEFYSRLDMDPPYEHIQDALDTDPN